LISDGWAAHGDNIIAAEEREHAALWQEFARGLGTEVGEVETAEVRLLIDRMRQYFTEDATSIGALYAFELQQPRTAQSKLAGLKAHYPTVPASSYKYFEIHSRDDEEPALLRSRLAALPPGERERALVACEETCRLLREALDGIYMQQGDGKMAAGCQ
jgi:pyrroloquinoline-quinone synthase